MPDYSVNKPIWPGSSSFSTGDTPFGFFDNDTLFQQQADSYNTILRSDRKQRK